MNITKLKARKFDDIWVIGVFIILTIGVFFSVRLNAPGTPDELAYLSQAARYAGIDGKELMQYFWFYGQGVSILWMPLFIIFKSPIIIYKTIIFLNFIWLLVSFLLALSTSKILFRDINGGVRVILAFAAILYPSNIYYAQAACTETFLYLLFWIVFYGFVCLENKRHKGMPLLLIAMAVMMSVHYRTILVIGISIVFFFVYKIKKKINLLETIAGIGAGLLSYLIYHILKNNHFDYVGGVNDLVEVNSTIDYVDVIINLFKNIPLFFQSVLDEAVPFILIVSLPFLTFFFVAFKEVLRVLSDEVKLSYVYLLIMIIGNICANATSHLHGIDRLDKLVYTRYMDNLLGPIILIGMLEMWRCYIRLPKYLCLISIVLTKSSVLDIISKSKNVASGLFAVDASVGIGSLLGFYPTYDKLVHTYIGLFIFFCITFCLWQLTANTKLFVKCFISLFVLFWIILCVKATTAFYAQRIEKEANYQEVVQYIENEQPQGIVYIRDPEHSATCSEAKYVQWLLLNEYTIEVSNEKDLIFEAIDTNNIYITTTGRCEKLFADTRWSLVFKNENISVYRFL